MAEYLSHTSEKNEAHERKIRQESHEAPKHEKHEQQRKTPEHEKRPDTHEELERRVKHEAKSSHETHVDEFKETRQEPTFGAQRELKAHAYKQALQKIRSRLTPTERAFSKFIHQSAIESISEASGKTVARPSGILGGGLVALMGSGVLLYMSKHYGFRYNFFVYILFFAVGFALGVVLELLFRAGRSKS